MTLAISHIAVFVLGAVFGIVITRYGFALGYNALYQAQDNVPFNDNSAPIEQSHTEDEPIKQDETEVL